MIFPYRRYEMVGTDGKGIDVYRPVIAAIAIGSGGHATVYGLLDAGSDITLLPGALKNMLGVGDKVGTSSFRGAGGYVVAVDFHRIKFHLHDPVKSGEWHEWEATVGLLEIDGVTIFGHSGFLELFTRTFHYEKREVTLKNNRRLKALR